MKRCVFELTEKGLQIESEMAPGIDLERDILANMDFEPIINDPKTMDKLHLCRSAHGA